MTMQGISNVLPKAAAAVAEKSEKAKGTLFEAVMSMRACTKSCKFCCTSMRSFSIFKRSFSGSIRFTR